MWSPASPSCQRKILMFGYSCTDCVQYLIVADCGFLNDPDNGQVDTSSGTTFSSTATYTCNTGYTLSSSQSRTCGADRNWTSTEPSCYSKSSLHVKCKAVIRSTTTYNDCC